MSGGSETLTVVTGEGRAVPGPGDNAPVRFELGPADFIVSINGAPLTATYRDLRTVAVDQGRVMLDVGGTSRLIAERLGAGLGTLVGELRDRRARQMLHDRFIEIPESEAIDLVEYESADEHGVAQIAFHPWGVAIMPIDERREWRLLRRADIAQVAADQSSGRVTISVRPRPAAPNAAAIQLVALGAAAERMRARVDALRLGALADAARIVNAVIPDATATDRATASGLLVDGRPAAPEELGTAWASVESGVLAEPTYAASYRALVERAAPAVGSGAARRWISLAPVQPGAPDQHMAWFFVALPGNLLAFELVSEGSHATYLFRAVDALEAAVNDVSECLIDARFLREPIYMTEPELADPAHTRYRFAIAALPSLRAARSRFVRRLIHTDDESWARSLDEAIQTEGARA